jgi:dipeptide/tripeptide permease
VNGGTTVLGSILAVMIAIEMNFTTVFVLAAAGYAIALGLLALLRRRGPETATPE